MNISAVLLKIFGWKIVLSVPDIPKCVICVAPHTSNWDLIIGKLGYTAIGRDAYFLIKKEWFRFPLNRLFRAIGGIPIDRSHRTSVTDQLASEFTKYPIFHLAITPEGTRKANPEWKKGFYYIALKAGVPIQLAYIDYARKEVGITKTIIPTGNIETDMCEIKEFYKGVQGKKTENFVL